MNNSYGTAEQLVATIGYQAAGPARRAAVSQLRSGLRPGP